MTTSAIMLYSRIIRQKIQHFAKPARGKDVLRRFCGVKAHYRLYVRVTVHKFAKIKKKSNEIYLKLRHDKHYHTDNTDRI